MAIQEITKTTESIELISKNLNSRNSLDSLMLTATNYLKLILDNNNAEYRLSLEEELSFKDISTQHPNLYKNIKFNNELLNDFKLLNLENAPILYPSLIIKLFQNYFPGCKPRQYSKSITVKLDSYYSRKMFAMIDFMEENDHWRQYLRNSEPLFFKSYNDLKKSFDNFKNIPESNNGLPNNKLRIKHYPSGGYGFTIPLKTKYASYVEISELYKDMIDVLSFSYRMNFVAEIYSHISKIIFDKVDKVQKDFNKKKQSAINGLNIYLKSRIINVSDLNSETTEFHKMIHKKLQEKNMEEMFIPFSNNFSLIPEYSNSNLTLSVYKKENVSETRQNYDYKIFPASYQDIPIEGFINCGVFKVTGFNPQNPFATNGKAPHIVEEKWFMALDSIHFMNLLLLSPDYSNLHETVSITLNFIEEIIADNPLDISYEEYQLEIVEGLNQLFQSKLKVEYSTIAATTPKNEIFESLTKAFAEANDALVQLDSDVTISGTPMASSIPAIKIVYSGAENNYKFIGTSSNDRGNTIHTEPVTGFDVDAISSSAKNKIIELYGNMPRNCIFPIYMGNDIVVGNVQFD